MKKIVLVLVFIFGLSINVFADWYVVNQNDEVVVKCDYQPDTADLESRNEIAIYMEEDISLLDAEYRGNKIVRELSVC